MLSSDESVKKKVDPRRYNAASWLEWNSCKSHGGTDSFAFHRAIKRLLIMKHVIIFKKKLDHI